MSEIPLCPIRHSNILTCSFGAAEGGREEGVLLVVPGSVPLTVVVALTRVDGSARVRDCDDDVDVVALVPFGRVALL